MENTSANFEFFEKFNFFFHVENVSRRMIYFAGPNTSRTYTHNTDTYI